MIDEVKHKFYKYQKNIFSIYSHLSNQEYSFLIKTLNDISDDDINKDKHLSSYSFVISIENDKINTSRFIVGTKTKPENFKKNSIKMLKSLNISEKSPIGFQWYGIGWDINSNIIKIYFLKKDFSEIVCKEYTRNPSKKIREKKYKVGSQTTIMEKDGQKIKQINNFKKFKHEILQKMLDLGFSLDTHSEYNKKITLYFD
tara:strand:- start:623 stop:1222 length:600 start_codon:yes stop_codon:yes gene_type:complete